MMETTTIKMAPFEYFTFEEDFVEKNIRCIPMIVRFKMDAVGIKLKLAHWTRFSADERFRLSTKSCERREDASAYKHYLTDLIKKYTGEEAVMLDIDENPAWKAGLIVPDRLLEKAKEFEWDISIGQWVRLTNLQRFALLKLCRPGHENKNFPKAMREFGW
jgi:hypothetical protein